jgi:eukaryotic-like serine/threonine-protein kinase
VHRVGIVHRDLKPQNVMLDRQGDAKLMDFGLAKSWRAEGTDGHPGYVVGTPEYMSPEQARGETVDLRSDIYALGVVCYEIFTGTVPFRGSTPATTLLLQIQQAPPLGEGDAEPDARLPAALTPVLRRTLAKLPQDRYSSALAVADALREVRAALPGGEPLSLPPPEAMAMDAPIEVSTRSLRAVRPPAAGWRRPSAVALAAALAATAVFWAVPRRTPPPPVPAAAAPLPAAPPSPAPLATSEERRAREGAPAARQAPREAPVGAAPGAVTLSEPSAPAPEPPSASAFPSPAAEEPPEPVPAPAVEEPGRLQVGAQPWAEVVVDGRSLGYTPMRPVALPPGEYTARLLHPDYPPVTRTVHIRAGETTQLSVDLRADANEEKN